MITYEARKKVTNVVMFTFTGIATILTSGILFFILGYLVWHGIGALSWDFFTKLPVPVGEVGGGMANAIVGSGKVLLLASLIGIPIGFLGGVYLSEFGGATFSFIVRYTTDLLNGVPSIVIGIVAYGLIVQRQHHFSTMAGGVALGIMMIPIAVRSTEELPACDPSVPFAKAAWPSARQKWQVILNVVIPAAARGIVTGMMLDLARVAGNRHHSCSPPSTISSGAPAGLALRRLFPS